MYHTESTEDAEDTFRKAPCEVKNMDLWIRTEMHEAKHIRILRK